jgi:hypothetical protein
MTGDFTGSSRSAFPYSLSSKDDQIIFSPDSVPESFTLSDPDHLKGSNIIALYRHWLERQREGLQPFIVLNASPNHWVAIKKKSSDLKGKKKQTYVEIDDDDEEDQEEEEKEGEESEKEDSDGEKETSPPIKIGPPSRKRPIIGGSSAQEVPRAAGPSTRPAPSMLPAPSTPPSLTQRPFIPSPKYSPKKKINKIREKTDQMERGTDRPATRSSSKTKLTQTKLRKHDQVDKVSDLITACWRMETDLLPIPG